MNGNDLGNFLASARTNRALTLREVERMSGVSNAYLSQVERGRIKQPSPNVLHALAGCYGISYRLLMERAGYPVPESGGGTEGVEGLAARLGSVTAAEEDALADYLGFIRRRAGREEP